MNSPKIRNEWPPQHNTNSTQKLSLSCKNLENVLSLTAVPASEEELKEKIEQKCTLQGAKIRLRGGSIPYGFFMQNLPTACPNLTPLIYTPNFSIVPYNPLPSCYNGPMICYPLPPSAPPCSAATPTTSPHPAVQGHRDVPHDFGHKTGSFHKFTLPSTKSVEGKHHCSHGSCPGHSSPADVCPVASEHASRRSTSPRTHPGHVSSHHPAEADDISLQVEIVPAGQASPVSSRQGSPRRVLDTLHRYADSDFGGSEMPSTLIHSGYIGDLQAEKLKLNIDGLDVSALATNREYMLYLMESILERKKLLLEELFAAKAFKQRLDSSRDTTNREALQHQYHQHKINALVYLKNFRGDQAQLLSLVNRMSVDQKKLSPCQVPQNDFSMQIQVEPSQCGHSEIDELEKNIYVPAVKEIIENASSHHEKSIVQPGSGCVPSHSEKSQAHTSMYMTPKNRSHGRVRKNLFSPVAGTPQAEQSVLAATLASSTGDSTQKSINLPAVAQLEHSAAQSGHVSRKSCSGRQSERSSDLSETLSSVRSSFLQRLEDQPSHAARGENEHDLIRNLNNMLDAYLQGTKNLLQHLKQIKNIQARLDSGTECQDRDQLLRELKHKKKEAFEEIKIARQIREMYDFMVNFLANDLNHQIPPEEDVDIQVDIIPAEGASAHGESRHISTRSGSPIQHPSHRKKPGSFISDSTFGAPPLSSTGVPPQPPNVSMLMRSSYLESAQNATYVDVNRRNFHSNEGQYLIDLMENMIGRQKKTVQLLLEAKCIKKTLAENPNVPNRAQLLQNYQQLKKDALDEVMKCVEEKQEYDILINRIINAANREKEGDFYHKVGIVPGAAKKEEFVSLAESLGCGSSREQTRRSQMHPAVSARSGSPHGHGSRCGQMQPHVSAHPGAVHEQSPRHGGHNDGFASLQESSRSGSSQVHGSRHGQMQPHVSSHPGSPHGHGSRCGQMQPHVSAHPGSVHEQSPRHSVKNDGFASLQESSRSGSPQVHGSRHGQMQPHVSAHPGSPHGHGSRCGQMQPHVSAHPGSVHEQSPRHAAKNDGFASLQKSSCSGSSQGHSFHHSKMQPNVTSGCPSSREQGLKLSHINPNISFHSAISHDESSQQNQQDSFFLPSLSHFIPEIHNYGNASATEKERMDKGKHAYNEFQRSLLTAKSKKDKIDADKLLQENDEEEQRNMQKMLDSYFKHRQNAVGHMLKLEQLQK